MPIYQGDGKYEIELPYTIRAVRELRVEHSFNEHATCEIVVDMEEEEVDKCMEKGGFQDTFLLRRVTKNGTEYWFAGGISGIDVDYEDGIAHVTLQGTSRSQSMDQQPKSRSYQNKQTTYTEMIKRLTAPYQGGAAMNEATHPDAKIGQLLVQYQETDWAFMKRLASKVGTVILPDMVMDAPRIYFGVPDFSWGKSMEAVHYEVMHDYEAYQRLLNREGAVGEVRGSDLTKYEVHSKAYYQVGDNVSFKGSMWVVFASEITYKQGTLGYKYTLMPRSGLKSVFRQNLQLQGVALEGKVISRGNNMVQVHLDIDSEFDDGGNWWFPYSSEGNNMFHALPEEGARIKIYFPDPTEKKAMAINSVRGKHEEMKGRTVFQKPSTKVFHIPGNAKMELGEDGVLFSKNTVQVHLDASNIVLKSKEALLIVAQEGITLGNEGHPPEYIKMLAATSISLTLGGKDFIYIEQQQVAVQSELVNVDVTPVSFTALLNEEEILDVYIESQMDGKHLSEGTTQIVKERGKAELQSDEGRRSKAKQVVYAMDGEKVKTLYGKSKMATATAQEEPGKAERAANVAKYDEVYKKYVAQKQAQNSKTPSAPAPQRGNSTPPSLHSVLGSVPEFGVGMEQFQQMQQDQLNKKMPGFTDWYNLTYIVPQMPEYLSKNPDMGVYYSRYTYEQQIVTGYGLALLNLGLGLLAIATAIPTGGASMYLIAIANGVVGVTQVVISGKKMMDIYDGKYRSNPTFLSMDQEDVDKLGWGLFLVELPAIGMNLMRLSRNAVSQGRSAKALAGLNAEAQRIMSNAKLTASRVGQRVKSGLDSVNAKMNPNNYDFEKGLVMPGVGSTGGRIVRVGDEPLFSFSSGRVTGGTGDFVNIDGTIRTPKVEVKFKRNPKHDTDEFNRQLKAQEEGINELTVEEFIANRDRYLKDGRALEGDAAQKLARKRALEDKIRELRKQGLSIEEAELEAKKWLDTQAALHNPDQIAGGYASKVDDMGDKKINSSIGSQWKTNIKELDKKIRDLYKNMTVEQRKTTYLNIKLLE